MMNTKMIDILRGRPIGQIGIVVPDIERALDRYSNLWGVGPWIGYTYGPDTIPHLIYRGKPGRCSVRIALAGQSPQIELLQPLAGPSVYDGWLETRGEGVHHLAVMVELIHDAIKAMEISGYALLQAGYGYGLDGDGGFAYFDTHHDFGVIIEMLEVPKRRRKPDFTWP